MLVVEIKNILDANKINFNDLDLIIATNGPGSYTGIRVALAVLKIIKITMQKPVLTVNCCEVLADKYSKNYEKINVAIEANNTEIYYAKYIIKNNFTEKTNNFTKDMNEIFEELFINKSADTRKKLQYYATEYCRNGGNWKINDDFVMYNEPLIWIKGLYLQIKNILIERM